MFVHSFVRNVFVPHLTHTIVCCVSVPNGMEVDKVSDEVDDEVADEVADELGDSNTLFHSQKLRLRLILDI